MNKQKNLTDENFRYYNSIEEVCRTLKQKNKCDKCPYAKVKEK